VPTDEDAELHATPHGRTRDRLEDQVGWYDRKSLEALSGTRSTCEALKHGRYLFLAAGGPCSDPRVASRTMAERVEGLVSREHAEWVAAREQTEAALPRPPADIPR